MGAPAVRPLVLLLSIACTGCGRGDLSAGAGDAADGARPQDNLSGAGWVGDSAGPADASGVAGAVDGGSAPDALAPDGHALDAADDGPGEQRGFRLDRSTVDFGTVFAGQHVDLAVVLSYRDPGPPGSGSPVSGLPIVQVTGVGFLRQTSFCHFTPGLRDGDHCNLWVRFRPLGPGPSRGSLTVTGDPGGQVSAALLGHADSPGVLALAPEGDFEFPGTLVGTATAPRRFTISTSGGAPVVELQVQLQAEQSFTFATDCPQTLPAGAACTATVSFAPKRRGPATGLLFAHAGLQELAVRIKGQGLVPPHLALEPSSWRYEGKVNEVIASPVGFQLYNAGDDSTGIPAVMLAGPDADQFSITFNDCAGALSRLACHLSVLFKPTSPGTKIARLIASAEPGGQTLANLEGTATP